MMKMLKKVWQLVRTNQSMTARMTAEELGMNTESVHQILITSLKKKKVCTKNLDHVGSHCCIREAVSDAKMYPSGGPSSYSFSSSGAVWLLCITEYKIFAVTDAFGARGGSKYASCDIKSVLQECFQMWQKRIASCMAAKGYCEGHSN